MTDHRDVWFLLRGLTREAAHWGEFLPALRAAWPDVDIHALDLPGAGAWHAEPWTGGVAEAMEQVRAEAARRAPATPASSPPPRIARGSIRCSARPTRTCR